MYLVALIGNVDRELSRKAYSTNRTTLSLIYFSQTEQILLVFHEIFVVKYMQSPSRNSLQKSRKNENRAPSNLLTPGPYIFFFNKQ